MTGPQGMGVLKPTLAPSTPVAGMYIWGDAADITTITGGATVTQFADKSGNALHLTPGAAGSPSSGTRTQNGLNVIDFDGINDGLGVAGLTIGLTSWTLFFVGGEDVAAVNAGMMAIYHTGNTHDYDNNNSFSFNTSNHPVGKVCGIDMNNGGMSLAGGTGATPAAVWAVRKLGTGANNTSIYKNGAVVATAGLNGTGVAVALSLGWRAKENGNFINGFCGEFIVYTTNLSDSDMSFNNALLVAKWGF